jgi:hypothetical protein
VTTTPMTPMPVAAPATARVLGSCSHTFASHAWNAKAITAFEATKARSAYGPRRFRRPST